jgi:ribonuclease T2
MWHLTPRLVQKIAYGNVYVFLAKLPKLRLDFLAVKVRELIKQSTFKRATLPVTATHQALLSLLVGLFCGLNSVAAQAEDGVAPMPSSYTLIIRLTPAACALDPELQKLRQCQDGFTLTISSLQAERVGKRLENCSRDQTNLSPLQERVVERVMPDKELRDEDWQKNGSCTGMTPTTYFRTIATYAQRLKIPSELASPRDKVLTKSYIINRLEQLNPGLTEKSILLRCTPDAAHELPILTELRSCYNTSGQYDSCPVYVKSNCPASVVIHGSP